MRPGRGLSQFCDQSGDHVIISRTLDVMPINRAALSPPLISAHFCMGQSFFFARLVLSPPIKIAIIVVILSIPSSTESTASPAPLPFHSQTRTNLLIFDMMASNASSQPTCQNCSTSTTPLWRRDEFGSVLCNACGLFLKLHGRPRPISLKTDVIKSRNRVKTMRTDMPPKKKVRTETTGLSAHFALATIAAIFSDR
jgi:hypothetical protein